jgi:hypothetical protein
MSKAIDGVIGRQFHRLLPLFETKPYLHKRKDGYMEKVRNVLCLCECGEYIEVIVSNLKRGNTRSCGCLLKEARFNNGKAKILDITGERFGRLVAMNQQRGVAVMFPLFGNVSVTAVNMLM